MKITMELVGDKKLQGNINRTVVNVRREAKRFVKEEAEAIMTESRLEVPVVSGALRDSGFVEIDKEGNATFGYGGPRAQMNPTTGTLTEDYMVAVHERLDLVHPNGKAKFLEDPVNRHTQQMEVKMAARLRKYMGGGK